MGTRFDDSAAGPGTRRSRRSVLAVFAGSIFGTSVASSVDAGQGAKAKKGKRKANKRAATCPAAQQCGSTCCAGQTFCFDAAKGICLREGQMVGA